MYIYLYMYTCNVYPASSFRLDLLELLPRGQSIIIIIIRNSDLCFSQLVAVVARMFDFPHFKETTRPHVLSPQVWPGLNMSLTIFFFSFHEFAELLNCYNR